MDKAKLLRTSAMVLALYGASACGPQGAPCVGDACPQVAGTYALQSSSVVGTCAFVPLLPGPSLELEQSEDGSRLLATFIDPVNRIEVTLSGDLLVSDESPDTATFVMNSRFPRLLRSGSPATVDMHVTFSGAIELGEQRRLTATLSNTGFMHRGASPAPDATRRVGIGDETPGLETRAGIGFSLIGARETIAIPVEGGVGELAPTTGPFPAAAPTPTDGTRSTCTTTVSFTAVGERLPQPPAE